MKNVLTLFVILAMTTVASAALQISVDLDGPGGMDPILDPIDSEIWLELPSDIIWLDVHASGDHPADSGPVLGTIGPGTVSGGVNLFNPGGVFDLVPPSEYGFPQYGSAIFMDLARPTPGETLPDGEVVNQIEFHCDALGDVIVELYVPEMGEVVDFVIIHQIPEPATVLLLGLGGLLLRRRRK